MFHYYQIEGGDEVWRPVPQTELANLVQSKHPMFVTVLGVDRLISSTTPREEVVKAGYMGPLYFDWDSPDIAVSIRDAIKLITKLETAGLIVETCQLYATGGKGFHMEISMDTLLRDQKKPLPGLPVIYKEMAMHYVVDALDLRVYSTKRGRMWRQPNVLRPNGRYKVPITWAELKAMTPEVYEQVTSQPRTEILRPAATYCLELAMEFERFRQKVDSALKSKGRRRSDERLPDKSPSIQALLSGRGIKAGTGFQQLSMQLAVIAHSYGWSENELVEKAQGLCKGHEGDGSRYNTQAKREAELRRMWAYMEDNPCYELSVGAIKTVLAHPAADLSGVPVTRDEVEEGIAQSEGPVLDDPDGAATDGDDDGDELVTDLGDEYEDLSNVTLSKRGVYAATELGPKRICGVGFHAVELMLDVQSNRIDGMNVTLGTVSHLDRKPTQQTHAVDLDTFESVQKFNRFLAQFGHAFQGSDTHVRSTFMKLSEMAKKSGSVIYTTAREGMDILSVPGASSPALREPFICWVSEHGVVLPKHVEEAGLKLKFQGYPDPRGQFRTDITDAVTLPEYVATKGREHSQQVVQALLTCQSPQFLAKVLGWMVACYFRMLFHKAYGKFPLLHVNGAAGSGKTETTRLMLSMFYTNVEPKMLSPTSTAFALTYSASGSVTPPVVIDEYKPHEMPAALHDKLKLMFRDAYNGREVQRGGGGKGSDDYRTLHTTQLLAPVVFIAEAMEEEAALMERVVLATMVRPNDVLRRRQMQGYTFMVRNKDMLSALGHTLMDYIVHSYSVDKLRAEFDPMLQLAYKEMLLHESDLNDPKMTRENIASKQANRERSVFNYTVAQFGLVKLKEIYDAVIPKNTLGPAFQNLGGAMFTRMSDLAVTTQAEYMKVLNSMADMSYIHDMNVVYRLIRGVDYDFRAYGGRSVLELYVHSSYAKYRVYCRNTQSRSLYAGSLPFTHGLRDCPAFATEAYMEGLSAPGGTLLLYTNELAQAGFRGFKE